MAAISSPEAAIEMSSRSRHSYIDESTFTPQTVSSTETSRQTIYRSNYAYFGGAITMMLVTTLRIIPLFFGRWRLGRSFSLSPLETAKAFEAPMLDTVGSNSDSSSILREVGHTRFYYGEVMQADRDGAGKKLCMSQRAQRPIKGVKYWSFRGPGTG